MRLASLSGCLQLEINQYKVRGQKKRNKKVNILLNCSFFYVFIFCCFLASFSLWYRRSIALLIKLWINHVAWIANDFYDAKRYAPIIARFIKHIGFINGQSHNTPNIGITGVGFEFVKTNGYLYFLAGGMFTPAYCLNQINPRCSLGRIPRSAGWGGKTPVRQRKKFM